MQPFEKNAMSTRKSCLLVLTGVTGQKSGAVFAEYLWYVTNRSIKVFYNDYWLKYRDLVKDKNLQRDMQQMMQSGKCYDAMLVINLLAIFKYYLLDCEPQRR